MRRSFLPMVLLILLILFVSFDGMYAADSGIPEGLERNRTFDLSGQWAFWLDPNDAGEKESWQGQGLADRITLPGTTDETGYGGKTDGAGGGHLSRVFKYIGPAWYQRDIEIPASWKDQEVELFLERVLWESKVWVDDRFCDATDSLGTPHVHRLGKLVPGMHRLTIRVNNALIHPIGDLGHCYTEHTQTFWNGIVGRIELRAHGAVWIERQRIFPSNDGAVRIEFKLGKKVLEGVSGTICSKIIENRSGREVGEGQAKFEIPSQAGMDRPGDQGEISSEITIKLDEAPRLWSEFGADLYRVETRIQASAGGLRFTDFAADTFGFRSIGREGHHIAINGRPTFIRSNLDCAQFPLTGYPPCGVEEWRRIFRIYKEYGMNAVRFHTWCPPEAAFQAADELGIYIQAEVIWIYGSKGGPNAGRVRKTPGNPIGVGKNDRTIDSYVRAEMRRMFDAYGNHPSFVFFTIGNELGSSDFAVMGQWLQEEKALDSRRFYSASTARLLTPADDFLVTHTVPDVGKIANRLGVASTDWDYEDFYRRATVPIIAHEIGQMPMYPCWDEIGKYTGVLRARNLEVFREQARGNGIEGQSRELQRASGETVCLIYKNEMESQLRTASCGGVSWLGMQDYSGQGEALIGWLDSFYDSKDILTPEQFRRYCNTTVPLARFTKFIWTNGETFRATAQIAHWGMQPLGNVRAEWRLRDSQGETIANGAFAETDCPVGAVATVGEITVDLGVIPKASKLNLEISVLNTAFVNDWNLWVFPEQTESAIPGNVVVCDHLNAAIDALSRGQRVLLLAHRLGAKTHTRYAAWMPLFWSASWAPGQDRETLGALVQNQHPALAGFPTDAYLDWQWHDLCDGARGFVLDEQPADYRPIVQPVSDYHFNHKLGSLFEFRTKEGGRLLVCGYNLADNLGQRPAARQLRQSLLDYASSPTFKPKQEVTRDYLIRLLPEE